MNIPMIPVVDSVEPYIKGNAKWLSVEDIYYIRIADNRKTYEYHTVDGIFHSLNRIEYLAELLAPFGLVVSDRSIVINPKHAIDYDEELRLINFPSGTTTVTASHEREIKKVIKRRTVRN